MRTFKRLNKWAAYETIKGHNDDIPKSEHLRLLEHSAEVGEINQQQLVYEIARWAHNEKLHERMGPAAIASPTDAVSEAVKLDAKARESLDDGLRKEIADYLQYESTLRSYNSSNRMELILWQAALRREGKNHEAYDIREVINKHVSP